MFVSLSSFFKRKSNDTEGNTDAPAKKPRQDSEDITAQPENVDNTKAEIESDVRKGDEGTTIQLKNGDSTTEAPSQEGTTEANHGATMEEHEVPAKKPIEAEGNTTQPAMET